MNKIIVKQEKYELANAETNIEIKTHHTKLYFQGENILYEKVLKKVKQEVDIFLAKDAIVKWHKFSKSSKLELNLNVCQEEGSSFELFYSFLTKGINKINIKTVSNDSNIKSKLTLRGVSERRGIIQVNATAKIPSKEMNNELIEDIKILNLGSSAIVSPNMIVESPEVEANHFVAMGGINTEDLFYLQTKGLKPKEALFLIKNGFLNNK